MFYSIFLSFVSDCSGGLFATEGDYRNFTLIMLLAAIVAGLLCYGAMLLVEWLDEKHWDGLCRDFCAMLRALFGLLALECFWYSFPVYILLGLLTVPLDMILLGVYMVIGFFLDITGGTGNDVFSWNLWHPVIWSTILAVLTLIISLSLLLSGGNGKKTAKPAESQDKHHSDNSYTDDNGTTWIVR